MKNTVDDYIILLLSVLFLVLVIVFIYGFTKSTHTYFIEQTVKQECLK